MIKVIGKMIVCLWVISLSCDNKDPNVIAPPPGEPCVLPVDVIAGTGTSLVYIGMPRNKIDKIFQLSSIDTLSNVSYYNYEDSCGDRYIVEFTDSNTVRSIHIKSPRIKCGTNITVGTKRKDVETVYGPPFVTSVYKTLNALHYDIEGLIFFVDDSTGLQSVKILPPLELISIKSGYGSDKINIYSTKSSISSLEHDSISIESKGTYESMTLIYKSYVYGIILPNDTTVSRIFFGSKVICDSVITKRSTKNTVINVYGIPDTQMQIQSLKQDVYCYIHRGVDFVFDTCGYVTQTVIYPAQ